MDREIALGRRRGCDIQFFSGVEACLFRRRGSDGNIFICFDVQTSFNRRVIKFRVRLAVDICAARREFLDGEISLASQIRRAGHIEILRIESRAGIGHQIFRRRYISERHRISARECHIALGRRRSRDIEFFSGVEACLFRRRGSDGNIFICFDVQTSFNRRVIKFRVRFAVDIRATCREFLDDKIPFAVQIDRAGHIEIRRIESRAGIGHQIVRRRYISERHRISARQGHIALGRRSDRDIQFFPGIEACLLRRRSFDRNIFIRRNIHLLRRCRRPNRRVASALDCEISFRRLDRRRIERRARLQREIAGRCRIRQLHRALAFHLAVAAAGRKSLDRQIRVRRHRDGAVRRRCRQVFSGRSVRSRVRHIVPRGEGAAVDGRAFAIIRDRDATVRSAHFAALDRAGIGYRQVPGKRREVHILNRALIRERKAGCFRRAVFVTARERTAFDGGVLRIVHRERIVSGKRPVRNMSAIRQRQVRRGNLCILRSQISGKRDIGFILRLGDNLARRRAPIFRLRPRHLHAKRRRFRCLSFDVLGAVDENILPFDIDIRRAGLRALGFIVVSGDRQETISVQFQGNVALGGVDRIDDKIAVFFGERDAVLRARREDAATGDIHIFNRTAARFENHISVGARRDARQIAGRLQSNFIGAEEGAPLFVSARTDEIHSAFVRDRRHDACRFRINRPDGG